jgi:Flp pilus assembly protein TadD
MLGGYRCWHCALLLAAGLGCALDQPVKSQYQTVTDNPYRDSEKAERETAKGVRHLEAGRLDRAETALKDALEADVSYGPAHNNLGHVYMLQGRFYLAAWEFEYANRLMPDRVEPLVNLGLVYEQVGRLERAHEFYRAAQALAPQDPQVLGNLARCRIIQEQTDEVPQLLHELLLYETRPDWRVWAEEQLALGLYRNGTRNASSSAPAEVLPRALERVPTPHPDLIE